MSDEESFPLARAELVALFLESMIFGAFTILYVIAIWILLYRANQSRSRLNKMLFITSTIMWVLSVVHLALDVQRADQGFITEGTTHDGTRDFYSALNNPTHVAKNVIYITMTLVGDSFVTYRLFVVWNRTWWIIVLPIILQLAAAISGYGACIVVGVMKVPVTIFDTVFQPWIRAFFSISLTTNILSTVLIAGRIMWVNRRVKQYRAGTGAASPWDVVETLIQSAAIYSAALASLLGTYLAGSNAQYVCLDAIQPLIGVVFTLIIIRVGLGYTVDEVSGNKVPGSYGGAVQTIGGREFPLRPVAINVSVSRTLDRQSLEMYSQKDHHMMMDAESGTSPPE